MNRLRARSLPVFQLHDTFHSDLDSLADSELLDRFTRYADHSAFETLAFRHGPMVFGVCRRILASAADADDAFQATFLVLIHKARGLHRTDRLSAWLYGVACRVAMKARSRKARLAACHVEATDLIPDPTAPAEMSDWLPILDVELNALPAKYRDPLVLCELRGTTRADAAKELGVPEGTLSSRLARGRELLRKRLMKHGALLPAGGLVVLVSANSVGRATVPATLLARVSELAKVATGIAPPGTVPVGAARLMDEVLRGMFLTKIRTACAAFSLLMVMAFGLTAAAWQADTPTAPPDRRAVKFVAPSAKPAGQKQPAARAKRSDRDALQGLWVLDKCEFSKAVRPDEVKRSKELIGKMQFLIAGDVWWEVIAGEVGGVGPMRARLDPSKNPKWIDVSDMASAGGVQQGIYELKGDRLRLCVRDDGRLPRPAEFNTDDDTPLIVMEFRREKSPPAAGDLKLIGSWTGADTTRVEILDGYLFIYLNNLRSKDPQPGWVGGRYTVESAKNPKWIDVDLAGRLENEKVTRLHGSYEVANGQLKLALGTTGNRAQRPLTLERASDVLFFDLKFELPNPFADWAPEVHRLTQAGDFAAAEKFLRDRLRGMSGLSRANAQLTLGTIMLEHAKKVKDPDAMKLREGAIDCFRAAAVEVAELPQDDKGRAWVLTQAEICTLQSLHQAGKWDDLLKAAGPVAKRHNKTTDGLIVLSLIHSAFKQKGDVDRAIKTRDAMKELFDTLKDTPGAFIAERGEYSRAHWEKVLFASP